jgi:hypothetical protein
LTDDVGEVAERIAMEDECHRAGPKRFVHVPSGERCCEEHEERFRLVLMKFRDSLKADDVSGQVECGDVRGERENMCPDVVTMTSNMQNFDVLHALQSGAEAIHADGLAIGEHHANRWHEGVLPSHSMGKV